MAKYDYQDTRNSKYQLIIVPVYAKSLTKYDIGSFSLPFLFVFSFVFVSSFHGSLVIEKRSDVEASVEQRRGQRSPRLDGDGEEIRVREDAAAPIPKEGIETMN